MEITLVGANGLIGNSLLQKLLETNSIAKVHVLLRNDNPTLPNSEKIKKHVVDFHNMEDLRNAIQGDVLICAIGTTKAKTPDISEYEKIDRDIPINLAIIAQEKNMTEFHLISAIGADSKSKLFYNRIKGEAEEGVLKSGLKNIFIYRPGLLIGKRTEFRFGELIAQNLSFLFDIFMIGSWKKFHSVKAQHLADSILLNIAKTKTNQVIVKYYPFT
jgi:uncharacterized protein YbjT (DUF2867 family)